VLSWIAQPASGAEADRVVDRIGAAAERAKAAGLRLGFHNHDGELRPLEDGRTVIDRLLQLDDDLLFLQLDLGWAWFAGVEPVGLVERVSPRAPLVHVKDLGAGTRPRFVAVGDGAVDYPRVLPAIRDFDVEWLLVEQDETEGDTLDAARRSFAAVTTMVASPT
jgi:sugar phosphate isomerase/epimerase